MSPDIWRLILWLSGGGILGALAGQTLAGLLCAALGLLVWHIRHLQRLLHWLRIRMDGEAPDSPGIFEELCREIDYLHARHRRRKRKLSKVLKQFQDATTALPDATIILDADGGIQWANTAAAEYLGIRWPDDAKQRLTHLVRDPAVVDLLNNPDLQEQSVELPSPSKPGVHLSLRVVPYTEDQRLFVARDVTRLHRLNEMRRDFVANVSHELRTPLTVVRGYIETLRADKKNCPAVWQPLLAQVENHTERMANVIRDLLLLSRLEQNEQSAGRGEIAVADMLGRIHAEAQAFSGERRHLFSLEADAGLRLLGAESELYSAFSNLIVNAVQYTPARGVIRVRWYSDEHGGHFSVEDNGIGIPEHHLPRITERFYRVDQGRSRETGGTGLGLAIVKHVLQRHQARLHIESTPGKGSLFRCDFSPDRLVYVSADQEQKQSA
ncbi:MAG TPA: phosphate regulon sensor histidine kinase PhoR [Gammaproteobacteria bacterium]|nr:phosphate regulon sensor histidine kinase PhoR [Gammaproteobacteria bacterium]